MVKTFEKTAVNKVVRAAKRASYDRGEVYDILDSGMVCHIGFSVEEQTFVIPTIYVRFENRIYIHGANKSRMLAMLQKGITPCVTVTHLDGLVLARSAFHHSMNYRSVVLFGKATFIEDKEEKIKAMELITEQLLKGRWKEVRQPTEKEIEITTILAIEIESASAKIRKGGPVDEKEDYKLPIWAGHIPLHQHPLKIIADEHSAELEVPESVKSYMASKPN
ncbi:pyridoxamine 5'-phosphate oxidase family protein [Xanthovirga aplysinae]|uniref:pyridoxamine 5'-phosphate oxidase family protein n=1 Tax=Xanthovirga aplysinae TaxID=2529853 RepID=UPI0012BB65CB|nr:pyridoxamine 5'-phosphate oxidase family protein [Xanthovirga aplysinae]MTI31554.1 pyridoxamine 5'-phosphate oxidase family protein [Xanthovirga aplysinae]